MSASGSTAQVVTDADIQNFVKIILANIRKENCDHKKLSGIIASYAPDTIYRMNKLKPELREILEAEPYLMENLAAKLKQRKFFSANVEAMVGKDHCSVLDRYEGLFFYNEWKAHPEQSKNLDTACEVKVFEALVARATINVNKIKNAQEDDGHAHQQLFADIEMLSNLYWFPGTVHGALLLTDLANFYAAQSAESESEAAKSLQYYKAALEFFLTAKELYEITTQNPDQISSELTKFIYQQKDLKTILGGQFEGWTQAQSFFCNKLFIRNTAEDPTIKELQSHVAQRIGVSLKR